MAINNPFHTTAASELVGTLILSALIVLVIGIVGVTLLSQGPPAEVPALRVDIHNESGNLTLIHRGGDMLFREKTRIFVDGVDQTSNFILEGESWEGYGAGDWLILPGMFEEDVSVQIVHTGPDLPALLFTIGDIGVPPGPWPDPTPTVTPTPTPTPTEHSINPLNVPDRPGIAQSPGYLQFRVNGLYSYIEIDGVQYDLAIGDTIRLTINSDDSSGTIYCSGWMLTTFSYSDVTLSINGAIVTSGAVTEVYISQSDSYISTLDLTVPQVDPPVWSHLNVDGVDIINGEDGREIVLYGMRPDATGLINIDRTGNYFVCRAAYTIGGVTPTPTPTPSPDPITADFSGTPLSGEIPLTVQFTDLSTGSPTSWSWSFGDGNTSTLQNPIHQYMSAGIYTVNLTATNAGGSDTETKTNYITVSEPGAPPGANFTGTPTSGSRPLLVTFTDTSTGIPTSWSWNFGDGGTSTAQNPIHQYMSTGTYTVSLTATNSQGSDTETKTNYITINEPTFHNIILNSNRPGTVLQPGYIEFRTTSGNNNLAINGVSYRIRNKDIIRLTINSDDPSARIHVGNMNVNTFTFTDVTLSINGVVQATGAVTGIYIGGTADWRSTLVFTSPAVSPTVWTQFQVDGADLINGQDGRKITLFGIVPNTAGTINFDRSGNYYELRSAYVTDPPL